MPEVKETPILCARCGTDNRPDKRFCRLCGAGRVEPALRIAELAAEVASMRDSLSGGALAIIGTLWPIYDEGAAEFASTFYEKSLAGRNLGLYRGLWQPHFESPGMSFREPSTALDRAKSPLVANNTCPLPHLPGCNLALVSR